MDIMTFTFANLPSTMDMVNLFLTISAVMCASGIMGVLYGKQERATREISALLFTMVAALPTEEAYPHTAEDMDPEVLFFGEALPEESALPLPGERTVRESSSIEVNAAYFMKKFNVADPKLAMSLACMELDINADSVVELTTPVVKDDFVFIAPRKEEEPVFVGWLPGTVALPYAKVNKAGRAYDPATGRFIAKCNYSKWVMPWTTL